MSSEEKFKRSLQDLVASRQFEMDADDWFKASAYLDGRRKRKRRIFVIWFFCGLLGAGWGLWHHFKPITQPELAQGPVSVSGSGQRAGAAPTEINAEKEQVTSRQQETIMATGPKSVPLSLTDEKQGLSAKKAPAFLQKKTRVPAAVKPESEHSPSAVSKKGSGIALNNSGTTVTADEKMKERIENNTEGAADQNHETAVQQTESVPAKEKGTGGQEQNTEEKLAREVIAAEVPVLVNEAGTNQPEEKPEKEIENETVVETASVLTLEAPVIVAAGTDSLPAGDSIPLKREPVRLFSVEGGALYMSGWSRPGKKDAAGFNPFAGIWFQNALSRGFALNYGLQYYQVGKLNHQQYTAKVSRYTLGEESEVTVYTPSKVHYVAVPLGLSFSKAKNTFGVLCNIAYLLTVDVQVVKYVQKFNGIYNVQTSADRGYTQGFNKMDVQAGFFYRRTLTKNWSARMEIFYGFSDVMQNDFFSDPFYERNRGLKLGLVYDIYR